MKYGLGEYRNNERTSLCKQSGIKLIKLPMKNEQNWIMHSVSKKAFQSVHIFISSSDTEEDVEIIKNTFERWRDSQ